MSKNVFVFSRGEFDSLPLDFLENKAIIRIHNTKDKDWYPDTVKNGIVLFFNDMKKFDLGFIDQFKAKNLSGNYSYFAKEDAIEILSFIRKLKGKDLIVHCQFGKSRSVAVAMYMREKFNYIIANKTEDELKESNDWVLELLNKY